MKYIYFFKNERYNILIIKERKTKNDIRNYFDCNIYITFLFVSFFNFFALKARNENLDLEIENAINHLKKRIFR